MAPKPEVKLPVKYDLILGVRRIREGSFAGLYEVVELDNHLGVVRVITDANSKAMAAGFASGALAKI